jgi:hypothetical protein
MSTLDESSIAHGNRSWKCSHGSCRSGISSGSMRPTASTATCRSSPVIRFTSLTVEPYGVRYRSICSVNASRSPRSQEPWSTLDTEAGGVIPSATDRNSRNSSSSAVTRRPRMPNAPSTSSNCSTVRDIRRRSLSPMPRLNSLPIRSASVAPRVRRANVMPRYVCPSAWFSAIRCCCAATRWSAHDGAPLTCGSGLAVCASIVRAHWSAGNGRVVRRRWTRNPARPEYCSEMASSNDSRSASGRNDQRISGNRYHAVTAFGVNVRCPAISVMASSTEGSRSLCFGFGAFSTALRRDRFGSAAFSRGRLAGTGSRGGAAGTGSRAGAGSNAVDGCGAS